MNCSICGKPVVLVPSAVERSRTYGCSAKFFRSLFTTHTECALKDREECTIDLMRRINNNDTK